MITRMDSIAYTQNMHTPDAKPRPKHTVYLQLEDQCFITRPCSILYDHCCTISKKESPCFDENMRLVQEPYTLVVYTVMVYFPIAFTNSARTGALGDIHSVPDSVELMDPASHYFEN